MIPIFYPASFLVVQWVVLLLVPELSRPAAYVAMVAAPLLTAAVLLVRGRSEARANRGAWYALALALAIWSFGAFDNLWQELIEGRANEMYPGSMLAFNLAAVPIAFVLASDWRGSGRSLARAGDAVLALALGYLFFLYTWETLTAHGKPDDSAVQSMVWLLDAQNLFLTAGALVRWVAGDSRPESDFFRAIFLFELVYGSIAFVNDHFVAGDPAFGPQVGSVVTLAFALLAWLALLPSAKSALSRPNARLVRAVRSASPTMLAGTLLIVSLFVVRSNYPIGTAGILIAVLGYGLRTTLNQVVQIERGEILQRERSKLQSIAWTDALTGLANRRYMDQRLRRVTGQDTPGDLPLSVLMIDVDFFKLLNDRYGHPIGDLCLRQIAQVLRGAIIRPRDLIARYGGEEFVVLVRDADATGAMVIAERLRAAVEALQIENLDSPYGVVTVSVGAATVPREDSTTAANLLAIADQALYEAKHGGRNQIRGLTASSE